MNKLLLILLLFLSAHISGQELNCQVQVSSRQIEGSQKAVFDAMQKSIYEFVNNRKWTDDVFKNEERIECSILINITGRISSEEFEATFQVQSRRPVHNSSYNTTVFNYVDENVKIKYQQFENLQFNLTTHTSNLTAVLGYYAYMILGYDYDTFADEGGTPYFQNALTIVNNAQGTDDDGWKAFETENRYWLVENALNRQFEPLRHCMYKYHRTGLDVLYENTDKGRESITEGLELLREVHRAKPNSYNMRLFFVAKADEIVNIYTPAPPQEKTRVVNLLNEINTANSSKYQKILKGK